MCLPDVEDLPGTPPELGLPDQKGIETMWSIISWIIVGGIAGWIASKVVGKDAQMGILANIIAGIAGAFILGFITSLIFDYDFTDAGAWSIEGFIGAIVGAALLIWIISLIRGRTGARR